VVLFVAPSSPSYSEWHYGARKSGSSRDSPHGLWAPHDRQGCARRRVDAAGRAVNHCHGAKAAGIAAA